VASQIIGLVVMRYVLRMPGVADASVEQLVERIGPVIEHHLFGRSAPAGVGPAEPVYSAGAEE
jgi:hypothetical protein